MEQQPVVQPPQGVVRPGDLTSQWEFACIATLRPHCTRKYIRYIQHAHPEDIQAAADGQRGRTLIQV